LKLGPLRRFLPFFSRLGALGGGVKLFFFADRPLGKKGEILSRAVCEFGTERLQNELSLSFSASCNTFAVLFLHLDFSSASFIQILFSYIKDCK
jgi:hypothetical protein